MATVDQETMETITALIVDGKVDPIDWTDAADVDQRALLRFCQNTTLALKSIVEDKPIDLNEPERVSLLMATVAQAFQVGYEARRQVEARG